MVSFLIEEMLTQLGATVRHAARVAAAAAEVEARLPSLAILDVNIGGESVFPIAECLQAHGIPFVFITGYGRDGLHGKWLEHDVLQKPLTRQEFEQGMCRLLGP